MSQEFRSDRGSEKLQSPIPNIPRLGCLPVRKLHVLGLFHLAVQVTIHLPLQLAKTKHICSFVPDQQTNRRIISFLSKKYVSSLPVVDRIVDDSNKSVQEAPVDHGRGVIFHRRVLLRRHQGVRCLTYPSWGAPFHRVLRSLVVRETLLLGPVSPRMHNWKDWRFHKWLCHFMSQFTRRGHVN